MEEVFQVFLKFIAGWWWIFLPIILFPIFWELYVFYIQARYLSGIKFNLLEIRLPKEVEKTPKAMEQVWTDFHAPHDVFNLKELYIKGEVVQWVSCEIVSDGGNIHFYVRTPSTLKNLVESAIYSQYSEAEITEVEDYVRSIPVDVPNSAYDLWGSDLVFTKPNPYSMRTYEEFEDVKEEKRIDPLSAMLEGLSTLQEGEQIWIQILAQPILFESRPEAEKLVAKLFGKKVDKKPGATDELKKFMGDFVDIISTGRQAETKQEKDNMEVFKMFTLTPGERPILEGIERKMDKFQFYCNIRFLYVARKDIFFKPKIRLFLAPLKQLSSLNANGLKVGPNKTKINYFFIDRRVFYRKRRLMRFYRSRFFESWYPPLVLNTEELATIFHFPGKMVASAPTVLRVEARKGEPPTILPIGDFEE
ncbi:MAG: hypothetical protein PHW43_05125 [Syntrophales bacterium]|nr:hypothetical protein [Syntrophales bacterium]